MTRMRPTTLLKKKTLAQLFSCEFCEISKNTFSYRTPPVAAFAVGLSIMVVLSESYLQNLEKALTFGIAPKTFRRYVDDSHA